jgi:hypothetical protein
MKKLVFLVASLALVGCAEMELADTASVAEPTLTVGQSSIVEDEDGNLFEVSIVHDGSLSPVEEATLLENIEVVGLSPIDTGITPVGAETIFVPPVDPVLVPSDDRRINIYIVGIDADLLLGNY